MFQAFSEGEGHRMASLNLRPLGDRVVVKPLEREEVTKSGIVLPDTAKEKPQQGEVLAVGPGRVLDTGERVVPVVKPLEREEVTKSGIVLPDTAKEKPQQGEVLAVGPGRVLDTGERVVPDVKAGERVLFAKYSGTEFKLDQDDLLILRESDVLAIVTSNGN